MKSIIQKKYMFFILLFSALSFNSAAGTYHYNADVKGMVCAFCAYNVSKNISKLAGVDADSVNVDLKGGHVAFNSNEKVSEKKLAALFSESGFTISNLTLNTSSTDTEKLSHDLRLELNIDIFEVDDLISVIESIGKIAASTPSRLIIEAPVSQEEIILKPLLMGRQQVIKVRFIPVKSDKINLKLLKGSSVN